MKSKNQWLMALGAGLATGWLLGVLFAPRKGADTRKQWGDSLRRTKSGLGDRYRNLKSDWNELKDSLQDKVASTDEKTEEYA